MVKIAIAGASSQLGREVLDALVASGSHDILALVRKDPSLFPPLHRVEWKQTNFEDKDELASVLRGTHTVLCFFLSATPDPEGLVQKPLIDACIDAGVKRFAPSEWQMGPKLAEAIDYMPQYVSKLAARKYLEQLNRDKKVIEYTLFQGGHFMNYLAAPHKTTNHVATFHTFFDIEHGRALLDENHRDAEICFTEISDIANVVARAVEYQGEWPVDGGMTGTRIKISDLLAMIEKITGHLSGLRLSATFSEEDDPLADQILGEQLSVDWVKEEDYLQGNLKSDMRLKIEHPALASLSQEQYDEAIKWSLIGLLATLSRGAWEVSASWNQILPDYKFTELEDFLQRTWGKADGEQSSTV